MFSVPSIVKCFQCKKSPNQFTFLLCNHIICGQCISNNTQTTNKYNLVRCSCGSTTYFNEQNQIMDNQSNKNSQLKSQIQRNSRKSNNNRDQKTIQNQAKRKRKNSVQKISFDQRECFQSRQTINPTSKTLINERSTMPMLQVSQVFSLNRSDQYQYQQYQPKSPAKQKYINSNNASCMRFKPGTEKTMYQQSLLLDNYQNGQSKRRQSVQPINQFSRHEINRSSNSQSSQKIINASKLEVAEDTKQSKMGKQCNKTQNYLSNKTNNQQITNKVNNIISKTRKKDPLHSQFQNEIEFLNILFNKDMQQINFCIKKILQDFQDKYKKLQDQLRSLYVQNIITKQSLLTLNLSELIKKKYEDTIGRGFKLLKDKILNGNHSQKLINKHSSEKRLHPFIETFQTFNKKPSYPQNKFNSSIYQNQTNYQKQNNLPNYPSKTVLKNNPNNGKYQNLNRISKFQTVEQRMAKFKSHQKQTKNNHQMLYNGFDFDHLNKDISNYDNNTLGFDSSKRIQTQNIHTQIKKSKRPDNYQNERLTYNQHNDIKSQQFCIKSYKPTHKSYSQAKDYNFKNRHKDNCRMSHLNHEQSFDNSRNKLIFFSPPYSYCQKHYNKRSREAKNYISFIQKLCHEKKMKNNKELFKKVKLSHPYEFKYRE